MKNNMVNTKHDAGNYDCSRSKREIYNSDALYDAYRKAIEGSDWKYSVQTYESTWLLNLARVQDELKNKTYEYHPSSSFILSERGKTRKITSEYIEDRVVNHALCDEVLNPSVRPYLIYDNGASLKDRGIDFTRRRLETHLHKYYRQNGSNDGWILLFDFTKYYDNIRHDELKQLFRKYVDDETALWLADKAIDHAAVDVSYMTDEEYENAMDAIFNSLEYMHVDEKLLTGEKMLAKHLNVGEQTAQTAGTLYPTQIDNYIKIVKGMKYYARYNDDGYVIHESRAVLERLADELAVECAKIGITLNRKKTHICRLSDKWRFLQIQYSLTDTGRLMHKIHPKRLTAMRRKMKKLAPKMTRLEFTCWYRSWMNSKARYMSKQQRKNSDELYNKLLEVTKDGC